MEMDKDSSAHLNNGTFTIQVPQNELSYGSGNSSDITPRMGKSQSVSKLNIKESEPSVGLDNRLKDKYRYFYRPYRNHTQKGVNKSLIFNYDDMQWMNLANIIINTKNSEFKDIIELYRENHNQGYTECPQRAGVPILDFFKKKKKNKLKKDSDAVPNTETPVIQTVNNEASSHKANLKVPLPEGINQQRKSSTVILLTDEQIKLIEQFKNKQEFKKKSFESINEFSKFLKTMKKNKRSKTFQETPEKPKTEQLGIMSQNSFERAKLATKLLKQKDNMKIYDKVKIQSKLSDPDIRLKYIKSQERPSHKRSLQLNSIPESPDKMSKIGSTMPQTQKNANIQTHRTAGGSNRNTDLNSNQKVPNIDLMSMPKTLHQDRTHKSVERTRFKDSFVTAASTKVYLNKKKHKIVEARSRIPQFTDPAMLPDIEPKKTAKNIDEFENKEQDQLKFDNIMPNANLNEIKLGLFTLSRPRKRSNRRSKPLLSNNITSRGSNTRNIPSVNQRQIFGKTESDLNKFKIYKQSSTKQIKFKKSKARGQYLNMLTMV